MSQPSRPSSPTSKKSKSKRKSWFSFRARNRRHNITDGSTSNAPPSAFTRPQTPIEEIDTRPGPLQFAPNRIATLYVTPSERNLYLAAMSELDRNPQSLPLWSEPAPSLPRLPIASQFNAMLSAANGIHQPNSLAPAAPTAFKNAAKTKSPSASKSPSVSVPLSPKLVTSPGLPETGLQIREEFMRATSPSRPTRHALVSLVPNSFIRFTGFSPSTIIALDRTLSEKWPMGIWLRSEEMENMNKRRGTGEGLTWRVELHGQVWKRKGSQELHSIRLLLAILIALGVHGWSLVQPVQAAGFKKISHNLLFRYDSRTEARPPAFFALSLPLPDRISLISMPNKVTPAIITAVRSAIASNSHLVGHAKQGQGEDFSEPSRQSKRLTWGNEGRTKGVKIEGWVHPGVYRFWIAGMRRWLGGAIKHGKVDNLHPHLLTKLMDNFNSIDFELAGSIPLLPLSKGRDALFFSSLPSSNLTYLDTYREGATTGANSNRSESPVLVNAQDAIPPQPISPRPASHPPLPPRNGHQQESSNTSSSSPEARRVLPWTSILSANPPSNPSPPRTQKVSNSSTTSAPPPSAMLQAFVEPRRRSKESIRPLIPPSGRDSPKPRNVLMKKNSVRRRQSLSGSGSVDLPPPVMSDSANQPRGNGEDDRWSFVDPPANVGRLGVTAYDNLEEPFQPHSFSAIPATTVNEQNRHHRADDVSAPRVSLDNQSGRSIYEDSSDIAHIPDMQHPSMSQFTQTNLANNSNTYGANTASVNPPTLPALALGDPMVGQVQPEPGNHHEQGQDHLPIREPAFGRHRAGSGLVDVGQGIGVPSMRGSVGFLPTGQSVVSDGRSEMSLPPPPPLPPLPKQQLQPQQQQQVQPSQSQAPLPPPKVGSARTRLSIGR